MWCLSTGDIPGPLEWQSQSTQRQTTAEGVSSEVAQQCRVNCQGHPFFCPETHGEKRCCWSEGLKNWHRHVTDYCCSWLVILDICYHRCSEWLGWQSQLWSLCDGLKHVEINRCSTRCNFYWINQSLGLLKQAFFFSRPLNCAVLQNCSCLLNTDDLGSEGNLSQWFILQDAASQRVTRVQTRCNSCVPLLLVLNMSYGSCRLAMPPTWNPAIDHPRTGVFSCGMLQFR